MEEKDWFGFDEGTKALQVFANQASAVISKSYYVPG